MAFVLPAQPTFGGQFGKGLGEGLSSTLSGRIQDFYEDRKRQKENTRIQTMFDELGENASIQDKMSVLMRSNLTPEAQKQGLELLRQQGAKDFTDKLRKGEQIDLTDIIEGASLGYIPPGLAQVIAQQQAKPTASPEGFKNLANWAGYTLEEVEGFTPEQLTKFGQVNRKRIDEFADKAEDAYKRAISAENTLKILEEAIEEGGADPLSAANFADYFESIGLESGKRVAHALENPSSTRFRAAVKDLFQDLTKFFGVRPNQYVEKLFFSFLPQIGKSKEANRAAVEVLKIFTDELKRPFQLSEDIFNEQGFLPHDISRQVTRRLGGKEDQWDRVQTVLEDFHNKFGDTEIVETSEINKDYPIQKLPPANKHPGKVYEDEKGNRYRSNGRSWRKV